MKHHAKKNSIVVLFIIAAVFVSAHSSSENGLATMTFPTEPPLAGEPVLASIHLVDETGNPLTSLDTMHERKLHTIFIGQDLSTVTHAHPEDFQAGFSEQSKGTYLVMQTFPNSGFYAALLDYSANNESYSAVIPFIVVGKENLQNTTYDFSRTKKFWNYTVELKAPLSVSTGQNNFSLVISNGTPVTNLQMYLGSELHVAVIREDLQLGGHTHAHMLGGASHLNMSGMQHYFGPEVPFEYTFSDSGVYALIGQFKHNGTVATTNFLVNVTGEHIELEEHEHAAATQETALPFSVGWVFIAAGVVIIAVAWTKKRKIKTQ